MFDLGSFYIGQLEIYTGDFLIAIIITAVVIGVFVGMKLMQSDILKDPERYGLIREEDL